MKHSSLVLAAIFFLVAAAWAADAPPTPATGTVNIEASSTPVDQVLKEIAKATGEIILAEKLVSGNVTAKIKNATVEEALDAVAKSLHVQWRKIYVAQGSIYTKDADALAAQMRTVLALRFPDIAISPAGTGGSFVHIQKETVADEIVKVLPAAAGLKAVYLVTDDKKAYEKELKDESKRKVADYIKANKELMEQFLAMSPEERKAVLRESMNLMNQVGPEQLQEMMTSIFETDPEYITEMNKMGLQALMSMNPEARKNLLRASMRQQFELMKSLSPEQLQQFQQEAAAIAAEMMGGGEAPNPPSGH